MIGASKPKRSRLRASSTARRFSYSAQADSPGCPTAGSISSSSSSPSIRRIGLATYPGLPPFPSNLAAGC